MSFTIEVIKFAFSDMGEIMEEIKSLAGLPMTVLETMLKDCFQHRPDIQGHILSSNELAEYISWLTQTYGHKTDISASSLPVPPSSPQMIAIANKLLSDPTDEGAIAFLSSGYHQQVEDRYFIANHDISVSRMLRYMPAHWHTADYFEIYYAFSGKCTIHFPNEIIELKKGTILIVAPTVVHASPCYCDDGVMVYYMLRSSTFDQVFWNQLPSDSLMAIFFRQALSGQHSSSYLHFETGGDMDIDRLLLQIFNEYYHEETYKSQLINALMSTFFILLLRRYEGTVHLPRTQDFFWKHEFSAIISHIQTHYAEVTLSELSKHFHYSEKQISRIVQNCMGITYNQLILKLRMEKAAGLLKQNSVSVDAISSSVGYSTVSSFYRAFTKYFGTTPVKYLKNTNS